MVTKDFKTADDWVLFFREGGEQLSDKEKETLLMANIHTLSKSSTTRARVDELYNIVQGASNRLRFLRYLPTDSVRPTDSTFTIRMCAFFLGKLSVK